MKFTDKLTYLYTRQADENTLDNSQIIDLVRKHKLAVVQALSHIESYLNTKLQYI